MLIRFFVKATGNVIFATNSIITNIISQAPTEEEAIEKSYKDILQRLDNDPKLIENYYSKDSSADRSMYQSWKVVYKDVVLPDVKKKKITISIPEAIHDKLEQLLAGGEGSKSALITEILKCGLNI